MKKLFTNIKTLVQVRENHPPFLAGEQMSELPSIENAFLQIEDEKITDYGKMEKVPKLRDAEIIDCTGRIVMPSWCDSHTHLVYAGNREGEFVDRINGLSYQEIANRGGGIINSAKQLQATSEAELYEQSKQRLQSVMRMGTGAIEIKSGYGLTPEAELKMLRVIRRLKENYPIEIKATFLGGHAVPPEYKDNKEAYLDLMIEKVMPKVAQENLAEYVDIFCETGYFSVEDTEKILAAGQKHNLIPKIHVNQFTAIGGIQAGIKYNALSVDHLEEMRTEDFEALKNTKTMPVALPSCSLFLSIPYTPAREMIKAGLPIALATDYNPGSTPSGNMNLVLSLATIKMKMTPEQAINAATINGAYAMGLEKKVGSITKGKLANVIITEPVNSPYFLPYSFGENHIAQVFIKGNKI